MGPLRGKVSRSSALRTAVERRLQNKRADRSGPPVALGFVSQDNFAVLTAATLFRSYKEKWQLLSEKGLFQQHIY